MRIQSIGVLLHEEQTRIENENFIVWAMRRIWESRGIRVNVLRGPDEPMEFDLLLPHIDLTVIPTRYRKCIESHPCALNRNVRDISKTRFSANLVKPGDGYEGPVIVKTDRNFGGAPEHRMENGPPKTRLQAVGRWRRAWERVHRASATRRISRALRRAQVLPSHHYPVFRSVTEVPDQVFKNRALVVERFLPERDGDLYCVRSFVFFGSSGYSTLKKSPDPVVKASAVVQKEPAPTPDQILEARQWLGFDYGKFDYVIHEGEPVLLDVNRTPSFAGRTLSDSQLQRAGGLAEGLEQWAAG